MIDKELPRIAERDLRAEEEWCRVALNAQSRASRLSEELAGLARDHEAQGKLLQQAVAELSRLRSAPVAVEVAVPDDDERVVMALIGERDHWEEIATKLAEAVGELLGFDVGEHSSDNCPVESALEGIEEFPSSRLLKEGEREELEILRTFFNEWRTPIGHMLADWSRSCTDVSAKIDALRSQRAAEGGAA